MAFSIQMSNNWVPWSTARSNLRTSQNEERTEVGECSPCAQAYEAALVLHAPREYEDALAQRALVAPELCLQAR